MKTQLILFIILLTISANTTFAQTKTEQNIINKFEKSYKKKKLFKQIETHKEDAEKLVMRLKDADITDQTVQKSYKKAQDAYNEVVNTMIKDIDEVNTIGDLVEALIERKSRRKVYKAKLEKANEKLNEFKILAHKKLNDKKFKIGGIVDFIVDGFLPANIKKITDSSIKVVKTILIATLESKKFQDWNEII